MRGGEQSITDYRLGRSSRLRLLVMSQWAAATDAVEKRDIARPHAAARATWPPERRRERRGQVTAWRNDV